MASRESDLRNPEIIQKSLEHAASTLKISHFKDLQAKAIRAALEGKDVFVNLKTGYGKSAIFQALPLCTDFIRCSDTHHLPDSPPTSPGSVPSSPGGSASGSSRTGSPSILVVISPLVYLMKDQVKTLKSLGLQATYLADSTSEEVLGLSVLILFCRSSSCKPTSHLDFNSNTNVSPSVFILSTFPLQAPHIFLFEKSIVVPT